MQEGNSELLLGPQAKQSIEKGEKNKEAAASAVKERATSNREELKKEVESELTPQQKEIMEKLRAAKSSEERVKVFAKFADDIGLDPLLSLIPELGDAGSSIVSGIYLLYEAKKADLGVGAYLKIIGLQAADFAVGAIPVLGDVADYFFKANKWSAKSFEQQTEELVAKARKAGVPEEKIQKLTESASRWPQLAGKAVGMYSKLKPKSKEAEPKQAQGMS
jgi:hypothetical protein